MIPTIGMNLMNQRPSFVTGTRRYPTSLFPGQTRADTGSPMSPGSDWGPIWHPSDPGTDDPGSPIDTGPVGDPNGPPIGSPYTPGSPNLNDPVQPFQSIEPPIGYETPKNILPPDFWRRSITGENLPGWTAGGDRFKDQLGAMGYSKKARPYIFNEAAFQDPRYAGNASMLASGRTGAMGGAGYTDAAQMGLLSNLQKQYMDVLNGGPSMADKVRDQNIAQAMAMAHSSRNSSAARTAAYQIGDANANVGAMRLQEAEAARAGLSGIAGQYANATAQHNQMVQYYVSQGLSLDQAQQAAAMDLEKLRAEQHARAQATQKGVPGPNTGAALGGAAIGAAGTIGAAFMMSDRRLKKKIKSSRKEIRSFLDAMKAYRYQYVDKLDPENKERFGIMAQDLEKSKVGKSLVISTPVGKAVDTAMSVGALMASVADIHGRMKRLEAR